MEQVMMQNEPENQEEFIFPQGLAGFGVAHRFGFVYEGVGDMVCMQSLDQPEAVFILTPWDDKRLGSPPILTSEQLDCLQIDPQERSEKHDIMWMLVLNPFADKQWVTANMKAPIAINMMSHRGIQCIRLESDLALRYRWMPQPCAEPKHL